MGGTGSGGHIYVASASTTFAGAALAKGGQAGGDGGLVETSGATVNFDGARVDTLAPKGQAGQWLVNPYDLTIDGAAATTIDTNLGTTSVTLQTTSSGTSGPGTANANGVGDINITAPITVTLHDSPGSLSPVHTGAGFNTFSNGRITSAAYAYVNLQASRTTRLPKGWTLTDEIIAQYSGSPLPDTEQLGVGGQDLVRGYTLDDGAYDTAIVSRNELRPPAFAVPPRAWRMPDQLSPFAFVDAASGSENLVHKSAHPISTGLGADYLLGSHLSLNLTGAYALEDSLFTKAGNLMLETKATLTF